jgi:hypothetical protein
MSGCQGGKSDRLLEADFEVFKGISGAGVYVSNPAVGCAEENSVGLEYGA